MWSLTIWGSALDACHFIYKAQSSLQHSCVVEHSSYQANSVPSVHYHNCMSCQNDSGQNASPTAELFKHCWLCGQGLYSWQNKGSRLIFPAQVASSQTEGIKPSDYGRSHNLFSVFTVTLCHLLPPHPAHHNPIRSSPAFGIANLILPHPFIFHLVSLLPLNSHLHPWVPVAQTHACQGREKGAGSWELLCEG